MSKVFVGLSGGVDSSLSAALLIDQGYQVTGVYMKNWTRSLPGFICPWEQDFKDAKTVAVQLNIPLLVFDFEEQYRASVVEYMLDAYRAGLTPNPDIMCNQEIKFKLFLKTALDQGADLIATGHYAQIDQGGLKKGKDRLKDQSYFLYRVGPEALAQTLFPIGHMSKEQVRCEARKRGLITAAKPDSQGICFVGEVGIKQFLITMLGEQPTGEIINEQGETVGTHDGAIFYTIGQRHGLNVGGGLPYYVTRKDMKRNVVYVTTNLNDPELWSSKIELEAPWWINQVPRKGRPYQIKCRYRSASTAARVRSVYGKYILELEEEIRAASPGQSAVVYDGERILGGGIIASGR